MNAQPFSAYLINLDKSVDRLAVASGQLNREGISFARIPAVNGNDLPADDPHYDLPAMRRKFGRELLPGEIGCSMSHLKALNEFLDSGTDYAVIFEDDAVLPAGFRQKLSAIIEWIESEGIEMAVANLATTPRWAFSPMKVVDRHEFGRAHYFPLISACLLWTRKGATSYLNDNPRITAPVDNQIRQWLGASGLGFAASPSLASLSDSESDIGNASSGKKRSAYRRSNFYRFRDYRRKALDRTNACISLIRHRAKPVSR